MKKVVLLFALMMAAGGFAQSGPKIEFLSGTTVDYGTVAKDSDNGLRTVKFKNTGDAPLIITNVQSTCGCTVPSSPKEPIMPGKTGEIQIKYNMAPGPIRKTVTVESNAVNYEKGRIPLKLTGEVVVKQEVILLEKKKSIMQQ
ncbi:MAG TPA: DUF1573 domain-containing protein [Flavobacterium sp.]|nr:DUF1573 domain-containing protein [Flavobacterium sp.]